MIYDYCIKCPACGYQTSIDPALLKPDDPMPYCPECDEPLLGNEQQNKQDDGSYHLQSGNVGTEINSTRNQGSEMKGDKYYFDIGWEINKYCTEQGISPLQLIEAHKFCESLKDGLHDKEK